MGDQIAALIGLRFALFKHTMSASRAFGLALGLVLIGILVAGSLVMSVGLFAAVVDFGADRPAHVLLLTGAYVTAFAMVWIFGLLIEIQRSETLDFRKMMHLPVSLRMIFILNFFVALFTPALVFYVFPMTALIAGLTVVFGARALLVIPIAALFYLMLASWTYYVRGLLSILLENKRRRRLVLATLTMFFVLLGQLPNLVGPALFGRDRVITIDQVAAARSGERQDEAAALVRTAKLTAAVIPLGWLAWGAYAVADNRPLAALASFLGLAGLTAAGLGLGFRSTWRYYLGVAKDRALTKPAPPPPTQTRTRSALEWTAPFLDEDTTTMTVASLIMYLRQPNLWFAFLMPLVMGAILLSMLLRRSDFPTGGPAMMPAAMTVWPMLSFGFYLLNVFGMDSAGFRALILLPTERRKYLLAKNLALLPLILGASLLFVILGSIVVRPGARIVAISVLQLIPVYLVYCTVGNFVSLYLPYRVSWEGLRNRNAGYRTLLTNVFSILLLIALVTPGVFCIVIDDVAEEYWGHTGMSIGLIAAAAMLVAAIALYAVSLTLAGNLLARREQWILDKLVRDE